MSTEASQRRAGLVSGAVAHVMWGMFPLFWRQLNFLDPLEVVSHRVLWAWVILTGWLPVLLLWAGPKLRAELWRTVWKPRVWLTSAAAGLLIGCNWLTFVWAVGQDRVLDTSLGYYINPLLNVLLGVVIIRETLTRTQWLAVAVAGVGVGVMSLGGAGVPWISILLAVTFSLYGLVKKNAPLPPLIGLLLETSVLVVPAMLLMMWMAPGERPLEQVGFTQFLLVLGGLITIMPLALFAFAAKRVPLSTLGILQYIGPTLQFMIGTLILSEPFGAARLIGFVCVWLALVIYLIGSRVRLVEPSPATG